MGRERWGIVEGKKTRMSAAGEGGAVGARDRGIEVVGKGRTAGERT